jgi:5-formyltetrahydrofolate cyclo-ligase
MGGHLRLPKSELRRLLLSTRGRREARDVSAASRAVCAWVVCLSAFQRAAHLVAYAAHRGEIDPSGITEAALASGKSVYFPRVADAGLEFVEAAPADLIPGSYGIPEPRDGRLLPASGSDLLFLVPGVAFDPAGTRLGRGGGHYDRALATYPGGLRVGLTSEEELVPTLPRDGWDQPMDAVVTERRLLWSAARTGPAGIKENLT